jgi:acyl carrier protein
LGQNVVSLPSSPGLSRRNVTGGRLDARLTLTFDVKAKFPFEEKHHRMAAELDFTEIQALAAEILRVKPERIQMDVSFARDLGADSLDLLELIAAIEDLYKVKLSDQLLSGMKNVGALWVFLEANATGGRRVETTASSS